MIAAGDAGAQERTSAHRLAVDPAVRSAMADGRQVRVIVRTRAAQRASARERFERRGRALGHDYAVLDGFPAVLDADDLADLQNDDAVESVSLDALVRSSAVPDPAATAAASQSALIRTLGLVPGLRTGRGVGVAVLDSGIQPSADLVPTAFFDFTRGGRATTAYDDYGHGTHVSGLIAGRGPGVAPGVRLIGIKVLDGNGEGYTSTVVDALDFVVANRTRLGIDVVNLSLGHPITEPMAQDPLVQAVEAATRAGLVVIVSAGNWGRNPDTGVIGYAGITSPGNAPSAITVGAVDTHQTVSRLDDTVAGYSSRGPTWYDAMAKPDVVAPGTDLVSFGATGSALVTGYPELKVVDGKRTYLRLSGTSMATAVTTGVVALVVEEHRRVSNRVLSANEIKAMLEFTALSVPGSDLLTQGGGSLNAAGAIAVASTHTPLDRRGNWLPAIPLPPVTLIGWEAQVWSQAVVWGNTVLSGTEVYAKEPAWASAVIWGSTVVWGNAWATGEHPVSDLAQTWIAGTVFGPLTLTATGRDTVVWGNGRETVVWGNTVVWGSLKTVVWGNAMKTVVWGNGLKTVVWGN